MVFVVVVLLIVAFLVVRDADCMKLLTLIGLGLILFGSLTNIIITILVLLGLLGMGYTLWQIGSYLAKKWGEEETEQAKNPKRHQMIKDVDELLKK